MSAPTRPTPTPPRNTRLAAPVIIAMLVSALLAPPATATPHTSDLLLIPGDGRTELRWPAKSADEVIRVVRDDAVIAELAGDVTTHVDSGLAPGQLHHYRLESGPPSAPVLLSREIGTAAVDLSPPAPIDELSPIVVDGGVGLYYEDLLTPEERTWAERSGAEYRFYVDGELAGVHVGFHTQGQFTVGGLLNGIARYVEVEVIDRAGNVSLRRGMSLSPLDLDLPATPTNLRVSSCGKNHVDLEWEVVGGASGDAGVFFEVRRDDAVVTTTDAHRARVSGLMAGTATRFSVVALDAPPEASPNRSPLSYAVDVTPTGLGSKATDMSWCHVVAPDAAPAPPAPFVGSLSPAPQRLPASGALLNVLGRWDGHERRYAGYRLYVNDRLVRTGALRSGLISVPFAGVGEVDGSAPLNISAELVDQHGQVSPRSRLSLWAAEELAPAIPTGLRVTSTDDGAAIVEWDPVVGATHYDLEVDGTTLDTATGTNATVAHPTPRVATVAVRAVDSSGVRSLPTPPILVVLR